MRYLAHVSLHDDVAAHLAAGQVRRHRAAAAHASGRLRHPAFMASCSLGRPPALVLVPRGGMPLALVVEILAAGRGPGRVAEPVEGGRK